MTAFLGDVGGRPVNAHHFSPPEASAAMSIWQHHVAIYAMVGAYGQFDAPNEERAHMTLDLTPDQLLSTTRTVRKRLDLSRPVERELLEQCFDLALQAPTGGNQQGWHFVVVTDADQKKALAELYRRSKDETEPPSAPAGQEAVMDSAAYLAEHLQEVPVLVIPCIEGRFENAPPVWQAIAWASILPATWSFMLAARARGLGTAWTSLHLAHERDAAAVLGIPYEQVTQAALIPVAHTIGTEFRPGSRSPQGEHVHWGSYAS
jgi:nitroreductase